MEFSVPKLFEQLLAGSSVELPALQQELDIAESHQQEELQLALYALERVGFIRPNGDPPAYKRQNSDTLVVGRLRCSSKGFCFAIRDEPGVEDIYIHGTNLNGAWNGDQVLTRITKDGNRRRSPEGEVAAVIDRANPTIVGRIKQAEDGFRAIPLDDRLLFELNLESTPVEQDPDTAIFQDDEGTLLEEGQYAYIEIQQYPLANLLPVGRVRKVLGSSPETSMDVDLVCCKYNLPQSFSPEVEAEAQKVSTKVPPSELSKRQDFRDWLTVTIEPLDLQHPHSMEPNVAISLGADDEGWQLGVHIADVAYWIPTSSALSREALGRGAAVYLDSSVLPLFPPEVEAKYALMPESERLTISILLDLNAEGRITSYEIHPGVISPRAHLTYGQVQTLLANAGNQDESDDQSELAGLLQNLHKVGQVLRHQRHSLYGFELQLLDLLTPTSADESREGALVVSGGTQAHVMMTEFILAANIAMGRHLQYLGVPAVYRLQPAPSADQMQSFLRLTGNMRLDLNLEDPDQVSPRDFQRFAQRIQKPDVVENGSSPGLTANLLSSLPPPTYEVAPLTDEMFGSIGIHFGLGLEFPYCHATSPLRRYADLMNQQALHLVFNKGRDRRSSRVKKGVDLHSSSCHGEINWKVLPPKTHDDLLGTFQEEVARLNDRQATIFKAEEELVGLKKSEFMQKHVGETFPGLIIGVQNYGFFVSIDPILAEGLVHVSSLKNDWYEYRSRQQALVGRKSRKQFRLGDRVEVRIKNVDYYRQQIDLEVVGEGRYYDDDETFGREISFPERSSEPREGS